MESLTRQPIAPFAPQFVAWEEPTRRAGNIWWVMGAQYASPRMAGAAQGALRPMQMGPASLPTPLSPMRGPALRQALGIQCFPSGAIRRLRIKGSVTGARTGIRCHPPVDPRRQRQVVRPSLPLRSGLRQAVPRSIPPSMAEALIGDSAIRVRRPFRYCLLGIRPGGPDP